MKITKVKGYSQRSDGAAMLIFIHNKAVAMFEMKDNVLTANLSEMNPETNEAIFKITKGWGTDIKKVEQEDFSKLVFENFRYIV